MSHHGSLRINAVSVLLTAPKDAYCVLWIVPNAFSKPIQSKISQKASQPQFDFPSELPLVEALRAEAVMKVTIHDKRTFGKDEFLGHCHVPLDALARGERGMTFNGNLEEGSMKAAKISVNIEWATPPSGDAGAVAALQGSEAAGAVSKGIAGVAHSLRTARHAPLPPCEGQTFMVRVTIHKASNLQSQDADTRYDPLCEVTVLKQHKRTDICKKTNQPVWEEQLCLSFEKVAGSFWHEAFTVTVYDHRIGLPNVIIGTAALDIGSLYNINGQHQINRKWLPLSKSDTNGLVMGYIKISVTVLNAKTDPVPNMEDEADDDDDGDEDIVANLIDLPGARFDDIGLVARIVEAEGLPAMDESLLSDTISAINTSFFNNSKGAKTKELCDPYLKISQGKGTVCTSPITGTYTPKWDCVRSLNMLIPSVSPFIVITVWDQDFGSADDLIATLRVDTRVSTLRRLGESEASGPALPYLPLRWYNLYGSNENDASKFCLKQAKGELMGSTFRGRVLMGIEGVPKEDVEHQMAVSASLSTDVSFNVTVHVHVRILLCSMVDAGNYFFEVSCGTNNCGTRNRGKKLASAEMNSRSKERNPMHFLPNVEQDAHGLADFTATFRVALPSPEEIMRREQSNSSQDPRTKELVLSQIPDVMIHLFKEVPVLGPSLYAFLRIPMEHILFINGGRVQSVQMNPNCDEDNVKEGEVVRSALLHFYAGATMPTMEGVPMPPGMNACIQPPRTRDTKATTLTQTRQQLRAHFLQARYLPAGDDNGLSDPYVKLIYGTGWMKSQYILETLSPIFNETLVVDTTLGTAAEMPQPDIVIEVWDWDLIGRDTFLGRVSIPYQLALAPENLQKYRWYNLLDNKGKPLMTTVGDTERPAQVLVSFVVVGEGEPLPLPTKVPRKRALGIGFGGPKREIIPIPPVMSVPTKVYLLDLFVVGLRSMKRLEFLELQCPAVEFEIGGYTATVPQPTVEAANANYMYPLQIKVELPAEASWMPPLCVQVFDYRIGRKILVGSAYLDIASPQFDPTFQKELYAKNLEGRTKRMEALTVAKKNAFKAQHQAKIETKAMANNSVSAEQDTAPSVTPAGATQVPPKEVKARKKGKDEARQERDKQMFKAATAASLVTKSFGKALGLVEKESTALDVPDIGVAEGHALSTNVEDLPWFDRFEPPQGLRKCDPEHIVTRIHKHASHADEPEIRRMAHTCEALYGPFEDGLQRVPLLRGQGAKKIVAGNVKMALTVRPDEEGGMAPEDRTPKVSYLPTNFLCRVYVLTCSSLAAKDDGLLGDTSDPYIKLSLGGGLGTKPTKVIIDKENKKMQTLNPEFWLVYEMQGSLPNDSTLTIEVYDWDTIGSDELIGFTEISLEDRWYSAFGYSNGGIPTDGRYTERRDLIDKQGVRQGCVEMWLDMFPLNSTIPAPISVSPPPPIPLELRVVIWNTRDVILQDTSIHGEAMSDIYVRSWVKGLDPMAQETDVHYRSLNGEGNFNWRMLFPFVFFTGNKKIAGLDTKKSFSLFRVRKEVKPWKPLLYLQIYDDDLLPGTDDFIGECVVDLTNVQPTLTRRMQSSLIANIMEDAFFVCRIWPFSLCFDRCKKAEAGDALSLEDRQELAKIEAVKERNARNESLEKQARAQLLKEGKLYDNLSQDAKLTYLKNLKHKSKLNIFADFDVQVQKQKQRESAGLNQSASAQDTTVYESSRYWFACTASNGGNRVGDVQVSFELVRLKSDGSLEDSKQACGKGRSEPQALPEPKRPDTSFFWLSSPFKSAIHIGWKNYKWYIITLVCFALSAVLVYYFVTTGTKKKAQDFFGGNSSFF